MRGMDEQMFRGDVGGGVSLIVELESVKQWFLDKAGLEPRCGLPAQCSPWPLSVPWPLPLCWAPGRCHQLAPGPQGF